MLLHMFLDKSAHVVLRLFVKKCRNKDCCIQILIKTKTSQKEVAYVASEIIDLILFV